MYWCCKKIIIALFVLCGCVFAQDSEDNLIFEAFNALDSGDKQTANVIYEQLYKTTNKLEYLAELIKIAFDLGDYERVQYLGNEFRARNPNDLEVMRIIANSFVKEKKYDEAIEIYTKMLALKREYAFLRALADLHVAKSDFGRAREYFYECYNEMKTLDVVLFIVTIDAQNGKFENSNAILKDFYQNGFDEISIIALNDIAKNSRGALIELCEYFYKKESSKQNINNLIFVYFAEKDYKKAIKIAKKHELSAVLIDLYLADNDYNEARKLAQKEALSDESYYGVIAMLDFEEASDKKAVLPQVIENFKRALNASDNPNYNNYLGYLLIDFDIDIEGGIEYVKIALDGIPDSAAFIDSLAWGYYKLGQCDLAKEQMDKIPASVIESTPEIKEHFEKINDCVK